MKSTKKATKKGPDISSEKIKNAYLEYLLTEGKQPGSVYKFCLDQGIREEDFYNHFGSFEGLERQVWKQYIDETIQRLKKDKSYSDFNTRERVLAFYYTLLEVMVRNRSFILLQLKSFKEPRLTPYFLTDFKHAFEVFITELLTEAKNKEEIGKRPLLDKLYPQAFWMHFGFLLLFWKNDTSPGFEKTDAAVEKSVNLAFDLIGKGALDSAVDFAKFLYQNRVSFS
jgi:AcrR family transcriptional regulator